MKCLLSLCICSVWWIQRGRKIEKWIIDHIKLSIKVGINNQIWIWTHIIDRESMITIVYLLACVYCCCKIFFRFTSFKLRFYFINWYPTNGSILQWKIEEDRWNRGWLHQIRGRLLTWEAKVVCFLKIWWKLNEAFIIGMKPTLMKERRFDDIFLYQGWNMSFPHSYII